MFCRLGPRDVAERVWKLPISEMRSSKRRKLMADEDKLIRSKLLSTPLKSTT